MRPFPALALLLRACATSFILSLLCLCSVAQQQDQAGATPDAPSANHQPDKPEASISMQGGKQVVSFLARNSIVFPDLATNGGPLSPEQKFKLFVSNGVAPSTIFAAGMSAGINQALNSPAGYGQGGEGYGKRFGAAMARSASSRFFGTFLLASALREDPRFFVRNDLHFGGSVKYSFRRVFITRSDSGDQVVNWSGLLGPLAAEGLANIYYPDNYRTVGNTFSRYGRDLGWIACGNLLRQYWPRINRKLKLVPEQTTPTTPSGQPSSKRCVVST